MEEKMKNNFRIIRFGCGENKKDQTKKITLKKFYAEDTTQAYEYLKEYRKIANKEYTYFWDYANTCGDPDGNYYDSLDEMIKAHKDDDTIWERISDWFDRQWRRIKDVWYKIDNLMYILRHIDLKNNTVHSRVESWSIDYAVMDTILFNIPILKKNKHGCCDKYFEKARKILNIIKTGDQDEDYSDEIGNKAFELFDAELDKLALYIRLYQYYRDFGIIDNDDPEMVKIDEEYKKTLPYLPGSYDNLDYKRLGNLAQKYWNKSWVQWAEIGQECWD